MLQLLKKIWNEFGLMAGYASGTLCCREAGVKSSNSRRANFVSSAIRQSRGERTYPELHDCEMQRNAEIGLFTTPSGLAVTR